jgi:opacity protein-like surface antigen
MDTIPRTASMRAVRRRLASIAVACVLMVTTAWAQEAKQPETRSERKLAGSLVVYTEYLRAQDEFHLSDLDLASVYVRYETRPRSGWQRRLAFGGELGLHGSGGTVQYLFEPTRYASDTSGFSTSAFARLYALGSPRFDLFVEGAGGFIKFKEPFPPNGTIINGLLRYGAGLRVGISRRVSADVGYRHAHISNGMGLVPLNPSFDGNGAFAGITMRF